MIPDDYLALPSPEAVEEMIEWLAERPPNAPSLLERFMAEPPPMPTFSTPEAAEHFARMEAAGLIDGIGEEVDATFPAIWAVYYRHGAAERYEADSIPEAIRFLQSGEDYGELSAHGVVVDGEPHTIWKHSGPGPSTSQFGPALMETYRAALRQEARDEAYQRSRGRRR